MTGFQGNKEQLAINIINAFDNKATEPLVADVDKLKNTISSAYEADDTDYPNFKFTDFTLPNKDTLLKTPLTSSESTEFARFVKILGNVSWIKEGHDKYHTDDGKCPYCQRTLPPDFEEQYKSCFDEDYQNSLNELNQFHDDYDRALGSFIRELKANTENTMPSLDLTSYLSELSKLETSYKYNLKLIQDKIAKPESVVELVDLSEQITTLKDAVKASNILIEEHKRVVANRKTIKQKCPAEAYKYLAFLLQDHVIEYKKNIDTIHKEIKTHTDKIKKLEDVNRTLAQEATELGANAVSAEPVVKAINETIRRSGFQGFRLEWDENDKGSYQVVYNEKDERGNFIPATKLSEGETNFIAFLYFFHMVINTDEKGSDKESIVIIDDPVSSMDSQTLFIVSSLVKNLIDRCINASTIEEPTGIKKNDVAQIFILTHNVYFHANITPEYENNYKAVNFYHISKSSNRSKVKLCTITKDGTGFNVNPIKNSYAALWNELEEVETPVSVCNIIQRILGYYFLNLCGYTNKNLEEKLLKENVDKFLKDAEGNETQDRYNLVRSFLEYLGHSQDIVGDEVYYVDSADVQTCRDTFALIFEAMGQKQHYDMMMSRK